MRSVLRPRGPLRTHRAAHRGRLPPSTATARIVDGSPGESAGAISALIAGASFASCVALCERNDRHIAMKMRISSGLPPDRTVNSHSAYCGLAAEAIEGADAPAGFVPVRTVRREQRRGDKEEMQRRWRRPICGFSRNLIPRLISCEQIDDAHGGHGDGRGEDRVEEANFLVRDDAVRDHDDGAKDGQERASPRAVKEKQDQWTEQNQKNQRVPVPWLNEQ